MTKKSLFILFALFIFALTAPFLIILQGQTSDKKILPTPPKTSPQLLEDIKRSFPSVDYAAERATDESRRNKSAKYDKYQILNPEITQDGREVSFAHWLENASPLPVADSEIIVIGKVAEVKAHLSLNKNSVYSEFQIEIEKIFKNSRNEEFEGKLLSAERDGGIVNFPTGYKTWYVVSGQRMPKIGSRYLFFLTHQFPIYGFREKELFLLTGYELRDGRIEPLDIPDGGSHPVATFYKGKGESVLLADLNDALKNSKKALQE